MELFWKLLPTGVTVVMIIGGFLITYGSTKEKMKTFLTLDQFRMLCSKNQKECGGEVSDKIEEIKGLVITIHKDQTNKIDAMDGKREESRVQYIEEIAKVNKVLGRFEGYLEVLTASHTYKEKM